MGAGLTGESLSTFLAFHSGRAIKISDAPEYSEKAEQFPYNSFWEILSLKCQRMCVNSSTFLPPSNFAIIDFCFFLCYYKRLITYKNGSGLR